MIEALLGGLIGAVLGFWLRRSVDDLDEHTAGDIENLLRRRRP